MLRSCNARPKNATVETLPLKLRSALHAVKHSPKPHGDAPGRPGPLPAACDLSSRGDAAPHVARPHRIDPLRPPGERPACHTRSSAQSMGLEVRRAVIGSGARFVVGSGCHHDPQVLHSPPFSTPARDPHAIVMRRPSEEHTGCRAGPKVRRTVSVTGEFRPAARRRHRIRSPRRRRDFAQRRIPVHWS